MTAAEAKARLRAFGEAHDAARTKIGASVARIVAVTLSAAVASRMVRRRARVRGVAGRLIRGLTILRLLAPVAQAVFGKRRP